MINYYIIKPISTKKKEEKHCYIIVPTGQDKLQDDGEHVAYLLINLVFHVGYQLAARV